MNRRELLGAAAAAAVGLRTGRARGARPRGRVAVVGAGLAGLTAAYELERAGWRVTVLEARGFVGGRVRTLRKPFAGSQYAEAGGEFVHPTHRTLLGYVRRFGLGLEDVREGGVRGGVVHLSGRRRRYDAVVTPHVEAEIGRLRRRLEVLARPLDAADPLRGGAALDSRSAADLLDGLRLDTLARQLVEHRLRDEFGVEPGSLSLLFLAARGKLDESLAAPGVAAFRIRGGNDALPGALADLLADVRVGAPVTRVEWRSAGVTVKGGGERVEADYCVLTAPVQVLLDVDFSPELPPVLHDAALKLRYGIAAKTLVQYDRRFWRQDGRSGDILTDLKIGTTWEATVHQAGRSGILVGYSTARSGLIYASVPEQARVLLAADEIDDVFPGSRALLTGGGGAGWTDRFSRGAWIAYGPGQVTKFWRALRRPYGRVYLAGEHTDVLSGTMEGAISSGRRVAAAIAHRGA